MRTIHSALALTAALTFASAVHAQPGPGADGAVLRNPFEDAPPGAPARVPGAAGGQGAPRPSGPSPFDQILAKLAVDPRFSINNDIEPPGDQGPWMVCVMTYVKEDAAQMARDMCRELRSAYRLPAYVFTHGQEERKKEYERAKLLVDTQREFQKDKNLPFLYAPRTDKGVAAMPEFSEDVPLTYAARLLRVRHIPLQCAVLVGPYPDSNAADRALKSIRNLPPPNPSKVKLDMMFYSDETDDKNPKAARAEQVYVNPFKRAFLCRNPKAPQASTDKADPFDIALLRKLNVDEPLTLLGCKKSITLAIKEFRTFTAVQDGERKGSVLENFGFKTRAGEGIDQAAHDAHNLAELLRKNKIEAYALHTKYSSVVTVGGFDSVDDPNLTATQAYLERQLPTLERNLPERNRIQFFAKAMPMPVPR